MLFSDEIHNGGETLDQGLFDQGRALGAEIDGLVDQFLSGNGLSMGSVLKMVNDTPLGFLAGLGSSKSVNLLLSIIRGKMHF